MSSPPVIAPIVEGHGESFAIRTLITRIASELCGVYWVEVAQPFRLASDKMRKPLELEKAVRFQAARIQGAGGVLLLRDGDDADVQCPVKLARLITPDPGRVPARVEVVIAHHEYEAWFLAALASLRGHSAIQDEALTPANPEARRDAKGQLESMMCESYKETLHQVRFSALLDLKVAEQNSRSFRRMVNAVRSLLGQGST